MASRAFTAPPKAQCFNFVAPEGVSVDGIIDAVEAVVGAGGLQYLQHHGGTKFLACVRLPSHAAKMAAAGFIVLANKQVPVEQVGAPLVHVTVYRLPPYVTEEALLSAFQPYGKCRGILHVTLKTRPDIGTGTRVVKLEMAKPVPNFLVVQGHRVMVEYKGMRRVCSRCSLEGHFVAACSTPRCVRCAVFGHPTEGCVEPCRRCSGGHATVDCVLPRSYAAALSSKAAVTTSSVVVATASPVPAQPGRTAGRVVGERDALCGADADFPLLGGEVASAGGNTTDGASHLPITAPLQGASSVPDPKNQDTTQVGSDEGPTPAQRVHAEDHPSDDTSSTNFSEHEGNLIIDEREPTPSESSTSSPREEDPLSFALSTTTSVSGSETDSTSEGGATPVQCGRQDFKRTLSHDDSDSPAAALPLTGGKKSRRTASPETSS